MPFLCGMSVGRFRSVCQACPAEPKAARRPQPSQVKLLSSAFSMSRTVIPKPTSRPSATTHNTQLTVRRLRRVLPERDPRIGNRNVHLLAEALLNVLHRLVDVARARHLALERLDPRVVLLGDGRRGRGRVLRGVGDGDFGTAWGGQLFSPVTQRSEEGAAHLVRARW